jgi:hypothetical protein
VAVRQPEEGASPGISVRIKDVSSELRHSVWLLSVRKSLISYVTTHDEV